EAEADLVDAAAHLLGGELDVDAERLEQVGRAAPARIGAVAVLGDRAARGGGDQGRRGRDVEGRWPTARARGVDQVGARGGDGSGEGPHRSGEANQLRDGLPLRAQPDQEGGGLHLARAPLHDLGEHRGRVVGGQVVAGADRVDRPGDDVVRRVAHARKLAKRCLPCGVSTDSGWNWTPSAGSSLWRTPMTTSPAVALNSSASGRSGSATSEW